MPVAGDRSKIITTACAYKVKPDAFPRRLCRYDLKGFHGEASYTTSPISEH
jgi:hypothetical protein